MANQVSSLMVRATIVGVSGFVIGTGLASYDEVIRRWGSELEISMQVMKKALEPKRVDQKVPVYYRSNLG